MMKEKNDIIFLDDKHEEAYYDFLLKMKSESPRHQALAYLLTLDPVCREHICELFDTEKECVIIEGLSPSWHTAESRKTTAIAFYHWDDKLIDIPSQYSAKDIFGCFYTPYYWKALEFEYLHYQV